MTPLRFWMAQETAESSRLMKAFRPPMRLTCLLSMFIIKVRVERQIFVFFVDRCPRCHQERFPDSVWIAPPAYTSIAISAQRVLSQGIVASLWLFRGPACLIQL